MIVPRELHALGEGVADEADVVAFADFERCCIEADA
jgi:hypothetical protein